MKKLLATFTLVIGVGLALPGLSQAQLVLYDDFRGRGPIDPARWHGTEAQAGADAPNTETSRTIMGGQLQLLLTSFGETTSDAGFPAGNAIQRLLINDPTPITTIEAQVTVTQAEVQNCAANTSIGRTRAGIHTSLFNNGSSTGAGDQTGDIRARIEKRRDSTGANTIRAIIFRCDSAGCGINTTLTLFTFVTSWVFRVADTLRLEWDAAGDQVLFTVNGVENAALSYAGVSDVNSPGSDFRQLEVRNDPENCTAGQRRASMTARFDNVMVNP